MRIIWLNSSFRHATVLLGIFSITLLVASGAPVPAQGSSSQQTQSAWQYSSPEAQGMDPQKLLKVIPYIIENLWGIHSLMVIKNGQVVFENYYGPGMPDKSNTIHSVTKSITSILIGIALDKGYITSLDQTLYQFFPESFATASEPKSKITLRQLLTMTAGLKPVRVKEWNLLMQFMFAEDKLHFSMNLPLQHDPGTRFSYSNPVSDLLALILVKTTGVNLLDFADKYLFTPLSISRPVWKMDGNGNNTGHGGLYLSTRDLAKIGYLFLNNGIWGDRQIVSSEWVEDSTHPHVKAGRKYDYGYHWWIRSVNGCQSYRAWGRNGQFITVIPQLKLVMAVTSDTSMPGYSSEHYSPLFDLIAQSVLTESCKADAEDGPFYFNKQTMPTEIQVFLDNFSKAVEQKNTEEFLSYYSESYLNFGKDRNSMLDTFRLISSSVHNFSLSVDLCEVNGNKARIWGIISSNMGPLTLSTTHLIQERGNWKWYGNQLEKIPQK